MNKSPKVIQGKPLSAEILKLQEDLLLAAKDVIVKVQEGSIALDLSKVINDVLFVKTDTQYIVLDPNKKTICMTNSLDEDPEEYQGWISNLKMVKDFLSTLLSPDKQQ